MTPIKTRWLNILAFCSLLLLTSCVTTTKNAYDSSKISKEKEIESRVQVAITYLQDGKPEQAIYNLKPALAVDPKSPRVHEVLALSLWQVGDEEKAYYHFKKMVKFDAAYTRGRANYAKFLFDAEDYQGAYKEYQVVVADIYYRKRSLAYFFLARTAEMLGKSQEVGVSYQKAVQLDRTFSAALLELALFSFDNKQYADAQKYLDQYRQVVKTSSARGLLLGIKLARLYEDDAGEASYVLALKNLYPKSKEYLEYLQNIRNIK